MFYDFLMGLDLVSLWLLFVLGLAAVWDIKTRRIPNALVLFGLLGVLATQSWGQTWQIWSLLVGAILGLSLWRLGFVGGGDSKLLVLVSAVFAPPDLGALYLYISLAGAAQALLALTLKQDKNLPYAVPIFVGTLVILFTKSFSP